MIAFSLNNETLRELAYARMIDRGFEGRRQFLALQ